jgi:VWFA-related protein
MGRDRFSRRDALHLVAGVGLAGAIGGLVTGDGAAAPRAVQTTSPTQQDRLAPVDGDSGDRFGVSVALYNSTAIIGAHYDEPNGRRAGSAYVFERSGGGWRQQAKLTPTDGDAGDRFGASVAVDGSTALVGAFRDEDPNGRRAGSAYVFDSSGGNWRQQAKLTPADGDGGDRFGASVAVDGSTALVGAFNDEDPNGTGAGSAYVFDGSGGNWRQQAKLTPADGDGGDGFGQSVALDGLTALVGANTDEDPNGRNAGSAYVFDGSGGDWRQQAKLTPADGDSDDQFGWKVALDGSTALVGAWGDEDPNGRRAGSAYVFDGSGGGWRQQAKLTPTDGDAGDRFGISVALNGSTALVGANNDEDPKGTDGGSAYVFDGSGGGWRQQAKLVGAPPSHDSGDQFGGAVALDGTTALVGAWFDEDPNGRRAGSAYAFDLGSGLDVTLTQLQEDDFPEIDTFVSVRSEAGNPVTGLTSGNFGITEDGTRQAIESVGTVGAGSNVRATLVIDTSTSMNRQGEENKLDDAKTGAREFVSNLQPGDQAAVISFSTTVSVVQEFTEDVTALNNAIDGLVAGGDTALFDGVKKAIDRTAPTGGRQAVIVLADGQEGVSDSTAEDVIRLANRNGIPLYTIGLETQNYNESKLRDFATETGGRFFEAPHSDELETIYENISERISSEYRLKYTTGADTCDGTDRRVEVTVDAGGDTGSDASGYRAPSGCGTGIPATVCPASTEVPLDGEAAIPITLGEFENGFAGAEVVVTVPTVVSPESVRLNPDLGLTDRSISGQDVRIRVSDTDSNFQGSVDRLRLGSIAVSGVREGTGSVTITDQQVDNDDGRRVPLALGPGCGEITCRPESCPVVDGTRTTDPDADGQCEDFNGNDRVDFDDVNRFFNNFRDPEVENNVDAFDFNANGRLDFDDVNTLFNNEI